MRKIREVLRLRAEGFSEREIAQSVGCARSSVQICLWRAEKAGVSWPLTPEQDEAMLEALLYPRRPPGVEVRAAASAKRSWHNPGTPILSQSHSFGCLICSD